MSWRRGPRRVLVLGGSRSGKSGVAEELLARRSDVLYVATGPAPDAADADWAERVRLHRQRRAPSWRTLETQDVVAVLAEAGGPAALVDSLTTWLSTAMDLAGVWTEAPGSAEALRLRVDALVEAWRTSRRHVVVVSDEVGSGIVPATVSGRRFRDEAGHLNARMAAAADEVWLVTAGLRQRLK